MLFNIYCMSESSFQVPLVQIYTYFSPDSPPPVASTSRFIYPLQLSNINAQASLKKLSGSSGTTENLFCHSCHPSGWRKPPCPPLHPCLPTLFPQIYFPESENLSAICLLSYVARGFCALIFCASNNGSRWIFTLPSDWWVGLRDGAAV
jgi:hypothetical protein